MQNQPSTRKPSGRLRIKLEPPTCDQCRLNKVSCRAPESVDERCGQCEEYNVPCLWTFGPRPSGRSPPSPAYVTYLETQVGKLERKLREILPGINLNRELETLAQIAAPPRAPQISAHPNRHPSSSSNNTAPSSYPPSPPPAHTTDPYGVSAAPMLLKHVRLASDVRTESELPYNQAQYHSSLRNDTYWSETASTRPKEPRYHGQSSGEILLRDAKELKREFEELSLGVYEEPSTSNQRNGPSQFEATTYPMFTPPQASEPPPLDETYKTSHIRIRPRRPEFWRPTLPEQRALSRDVWATSPPSPSSPLSETHLNEVVLPPPDLIKSLVDLFFIHINSITPIFHRQAFEQELASGTHLLQVLQWRTQNNQDGKVGDPKTMQHPNLVIDQTRGAGTFARVVLLVCACASRWSGDPRVLSSSPRDETGNNYGLSTLSAGYSFFRQVDPWCRTMCAQAGLWDVQMFLLSALYLHGSSASYGAWIVLGTGIRLAQDIGAHRKKDGNSLENELSKRSFWSLVVLDRFVSGSLGRPPAMQDIDSDLENPIEVDDEYWPVGGEPIQPLDRPSKIACLSCLIGLTRVLGRAQQTVFATARTKRQIDLIGPEKERTLLNDLRYHMKQWQLTVPPHLRLPRPEDFVPSIFLNLAVSLWALYYNTMILIHRPFITLKPSPLTAECRHICRSSARACAKILDGHRRASGGVTLTCALQPAFSVAMVLLVDILASKTAEKQELYAGGNTAAEAEESYPTWEKEQDIESCIEVLALAESRWHFAGRLHDILREFQRSGQLPASASTHPHHMGSSPVTTQRSEPPWVPSQQPTLSVAPIASYPTASHLSFRSHEYGSLGGAESATVQPEVPHPLSSRISSHSVTPSDYRYHTQFDRPIFNRSTTYPFNAPPHGQTSNSHLDSTNLVHPHPTDPYRYYAGAYLPDASYGGDFSVPFPGIVPQLNFAPNHERGDLYGAGYEEAPYDVEQNSGWTNTQQFASYRARNQ